MTLRFIALMFVVVCWSACEKVEIPPPRPAGVPAKAVWAGGEDGGAWIECILDAGKDADFCSVYFDRDGKLWARTHFVLSDSGVGVPVEELSFSGFDGLRIYLKDGRFLVPLQYHRGDKISLAPIDDFS